MTQAWQILSTALLQCNYDFILLGGGGGYLKNKATKCSEGATDISVCPFIANVSILNIFTMEKKLCFSNPHISGKFKFLIPLPLSKYSFTEFHDTEHYLI
jgi:hypothetical protein